MFTRLSMVSLRFSSPGSLASQALFLNLLYTAWPYECFEVCWADVGGTPRLFQLNTTSWLWALDACAVCAAGTWIRGGQNLSSSTVYSVLFSFIACHLLRSNICVYEFCLKSERNGPTSYIPHGRVPGRAWNDGEQLVWECRVWGWEIQVKVRAKDQPSSCPGERGSGGEFPASEAPHLFLISLSI